MAKITDIYEPRINGVPPYIRHANVCDSCKRRGPWTFAEPSDYPPVLAAQGFTSYLDGRMSRLRCTDGCEVTP